MTTRNRSVGSCEKRFKPLMISPTLSLVILSMSIFAPEGRSQQPHKPFDVVSIKQNRSSESSASSQFTPCSTSMTNMSLHALVALANDIQEDNVGSIAGNVAKARFDVEAKYSDPKVDCDKEISAEQREAMLSQILGERFHLLTHRELKLRPVYTLIRVNSVVPGQDGSGVPDVAKKPSVNGGLSLSQNGDILTLTAHEVTSGMLAKQLSKIAGRPILDGSGNQTIHDVTLRWNDSLLDSGSSTPGPEDSRQSLESALREQVGFKLVSSHAQVSTVVVDRAEMPSAN